MRHIPETEFHSIVQAEEAHKEALATMKTLDGLSEDAMEANNGEHYITYTNANRQRQAASVYLGKHRKKGK